MKVLIGMIAISVALICFGCGENGGATTSERKDPDPSITDPGNLHFATISRGDDQRPGPRIVPPDLPPPKALLIRDIEVGSGPVAERGDRVAVWYSAVEYKTGRETYIHWHSVPPFALELGGGFVGRGFEEGIEGMRVGGRREMVIPARLMFGVGATDYVVELARVGPAPKAAPDRG